MKKNIDHNDDKFITSPEFNKLIAESFAARSSQVNLAIKSDIANFVKSTPNENELNEISKSVKQYQQND